MIILRDDQLNLKFGVYSGWSFGNKNMLAVLPTGGGKCLGRDTPVLMFDGTIKNSQDITVGDLLMGPDSQQRLVVNICSGVDNLYNVKSTKGDNYVVNSKHVLSLRRTNERLKPKYPSQKRFGEIVNIPVEEYIHKSNYFKHVHKGWRTGVNFNNQITIDPYWVGLWLGDGSSRNQSITTMDYEIETYLEKFAQSLNMQIRK